MNMTHAMTRAMAAVAARLPPAWVGSEGRCAAASRRSVTACAIDLPAGPNHFSGNRHG
jgi:hypothetical protein